ARASAAAGTLGATEVFERRRESSVAVELNRVMLASTIVIGPRAGVSLRVCGVRDSINGHLLTQIRNPNHEIRNKHECPKLEFLSLEFVSDFVLRASSFLFQ
ncbi:MAG: hypothetical protein ABIP55_04480, partial [Tepidisphaeraceae bacterium]